MSCSSCHLDLRTSTHIKCAECMVPSIQMCLPCFTGKFETVRHKEQHDYYVIPGGCENRPLITGHSFDDVLMLLDSSRKFSIGSWEEMRGRATLPTYKDCEVSFMTLYNVWSDVCGDKKMASLDCLDSNAICKAILPDMAGLAMTLFKQAQSTADMPGFISNRVDFEVEYDDSAELLIADIEFGDDDLPEDLAVKLRCLYSFNERIRRRESVKQFAIDHRLVSAQSETAHHLCRSAEEVELRGKLRPIERHFPSVTEYESFIQLLLAEARLVAKIDTFGKKEIEVSVKPGTPSLSSEDIIETKPITRSRANNDNGRKGKTAEEECARIIGLLEREPTLFTSENALSSIEVDAVEKLGLGAISFAAIRDLLLERLLPSGETVADIVLSRLGDVVTVHSSMRI